MSAPSPAPSRVVFIREEPIELCQLLKFAGLAESGGDAKRAVAHGLVELNGVVETRKRKKIMSGDLVSCQGETLLVKVGA